ncbi:MAG: hypothetical protein ACRD9R_03670 [Pyrinomonadaceae bacterium]
MKIILKTCLACLLLVVTAPAPAAHTYAQDRTTLTRRVQFGRGRTTAVIKNTIRRGTNHHYLLGARAGQTMIVHLVGKQTGFTVYTPDGGAAIEAADGVKDWEGTLPESGDYTIEIATDARTAPYTLEVTIR